jgi:hypothetical protein
MGVRPLLVPRGYPHSRSGWSIPIRNVGSGSQADILRCRGDVRFTPQTQTLHRADRRLIFCLEIALNQVGNFQIVAFGSLA